MELKQYFQVVKKWWWLAVASVLVATVASYFGLQRTPRIYQATTTIQVGQATELANPSYSDIAISQQLAQTYLNMVSRRPILEGVAQALGLPYVPWAANVSASGSETVILRGSSVFVGDQRRGVLLSFSGTTP